MGCSGIDGKRVDGEVCQVAGKGPPGNAVVVTLPDPARHAGRKQNVRLRRVITHDTRPSADVTRSERRPRVEDCRPGVFTKRQRSTGSRREVRRSLDVLHRTAVESTDITAESSRDAARFVIATGGIRCVKASRRAGIVGHRHQCTEAYRQREEPGRCRPRGSGSVEFATAGTCLLHG